MFLKIMSYIPADAVPIRACPGLAEDTSQIPSLWPVNSLTSWQLYDGALKLETILLVCTLSL